MNTLRIIFMGTPEFAVATLRSLIENQYRVVAVITAPDRPAWPWKKGTAIGRQAIRATKRPARATTDQP